MAPRIGFPDWWAKEARKGTPVVVTMENPNYSVVEIDGPDSLAFPGVERGRGKNARQFTWVLLLRAHRAVGCVAWLAASLWALLNTVKKRLIFQQGVSMESDRAGRGRLLFGFIRGFLAISMAALLFEIAAYANGWHFKTPRLHLPETTELRGWMHAAYLSWLSFRSDYIARPIRVLSNFCVLLFIIQSLDRMILCLGCFWIKLKKIKPRIQGDPLKDGNAEDPSSGYPMVLVQIPMCNEREVKKKKKKKKQLFILNPVLPECS